MKKITAIITVLALSAGLYYAFAQVPKKAPKDAKVYIISPKDGETVSRKFKVQFGLSGMGVAPAGVDVDGTGHHHLLIDMDKAPDFSKPLPMTENLKHFGGGQTETMLELKPGKHTLQLLLADFTHTPHDPPIMSKKITVTVK